MSYFTWKEEGLTTDCETLDSMASRFEESARLMRKMSAEGFKVEKRNKRQIITHTDSKIFNEVGLGKDRQSILNEYIQYCLHQLDQGFPLSTTLKHIFGLNRGLKNAKAYRTLILKTIQNNNLNIFTK